MKSYKLHFEQNLSTLPDCNNTKKYRFKSIDACKTKLQETKSKLDDEFSKPKFASNWSNFDPFKTERDVVAQIGSTFNVSNAWLKCYEILCYYNLLPETINVDGGFTSDVGHKLDNQFVHFDNAAFPGSFVLATHHLVCTQRTWHKSYIWKASSLLNANESNNNPLEDKYGLYTNYPDHWLMNQHNNGDVLQEPNQIDFCKRLGGQVDLYTSDLGFDVSSDFNNQELLQLPANIGQILTGLLTLKIGGSFITKQYTTFEPITISVMYLASFFFDEFYLCKPYTSRSANSETYLVGKGFKGGFYLNHPFCKVLFDKITGRTSLKIPIFDATVYNKEYMANIVTSVKELTNSQVDKINLDIERSNVCMTNGYRGNPVSNPEVQAFKKSVEPHLLNWYFDNPILPIDDSLLLVRG